MIAVDLQSTMLDLSLPKAQVVCELVAADHARYTLDGVMDLDINHGKSFLIKQSSLPGITGSYPGIDDPSLRDGQLAFIRDEGSKGTGIILRLFENERPVATISVVTSAKADDSVPTLLAGGVCKLEELK